MHDLSADAPAKINLTLRVLGRRADGFHDLDSIVARVTLTDTISVRPREDGTVTVACDDRSIPADARNLAVRAALALREACGERRGVHIALTKRIPAGAGLGGGSSDAATTLVLLNRLWALDVRVETLARIGGGVGSDVPLFLTGPVCRIRGRGEIVEPIPVRLRGHVVLVLPAIHAATPDVFRAWRPVAGAVVDHLAWENLSAPWSETMPRLSNDLESAAYSAVPGLGPFADQLRARIDARFRMSGSGSAFFAVYDDLAEAVDVAHCAAATLRVRTEVAAFCGE